MTPVQLLSPKAPTSAPHTKPSPRRGAGGFSVELIAGEPAKAFLESRDSRAAWSHLAARCPWATAFQSPEFASTWFDSYDGAFTPIVVVGLTPSGDLIGLFALALEAGTGRLVAPGAHQSEYQTWLAAPAMGDAFADAAFALLARRFPTAKVELHHLAPGTPTGWIRRSSSWSRRCVLERSVRSLVDLSPAASAKSLAKSGNRSRLNRLRREGEVTFERIADAADFALVLEEIVPVYDLRQGAKNDVLPFAWDAWKRPFHQALFAKGLLHVTTLRVGGRIAAAHVGVIDRNCVRLGVFAHSPSFARHSPGKLLLHLLFEKLSQEGFAAFDMTPGAGWKERFATRTDLVPTLRVCFRPGDALRRRARLAAERVAKKAALALRTTPDAVREAAERARVLAPGAFAKGLARRAAGLRRFLGEQTEHALHTLHVARTIDAPASLEFSIDRVEDLLLTATTGLRRRRFLEDCVERMARGSRFATRVENGRLVAWAWLAPRGSTLVVAGSTAPLAAGAVVCDVGADLPWRADVLCDAALAAAARLAATMPGVTKLWAAVPSGSPTRAALLRAGWAHHSSVFTRRRFGRRVTTSATRQFGAYWSPADLAKRFAKRSLYRCAKLLGLFRLARHATRDELRILAYHGFEVRDEAQWAPKLHMRGRTFAKRLEALRRGGFPVLALDDAVAKMDEGALPRAAVVLTIDDGSATVLHGAVPHLWKHGMQATFYATSYYVTRQVPVFRVAMQFALWKTPNAKVELAGLGRFESGEVALADEGAREAALWELIHHGETKLDEPGRQALAREWFRRLGVDFDALAASRACGLLTEYEIRAMSDAGFDVQLHTHRHRMPMDEPLARREIADNRAVLEPLTGRPLKHLCYPSNEHAPRHEAWLKAMGVETSTTCDLGMNPRGTNKLYLKRFIDGEDVSQIEFEAEVYGFAELLRRGVRRAKSLLRRRPSPPPAAASSRGRVRRGR